MMQDPGERLSSKMRQSLDAGLPVWAPAAALGREQVVTAGARDADASLAGLVGSIGSSAPREKDIPQLPGALPGAAPPRSSLADRGVPPSELSAATAVSFEQRPAKGVRAATCEVARGAEGDEVGGKMGTTGSTTVATQCGDMMRLAGTAATCNSRESGIQVDLDYESDAAGTSESRLLGVSTNRSTFGGVGEGAILDRDQGPIDSEGGSTA